MPYGEARHGGDALIGNPGVLSEEVGFGEDSA